jgi:hypothetical protein
MTTAAATVITARHLQVAQPCALESWWTWAAHFCKLRNLRLIQTMSVAVMFMVMVRVVVKKKKRAERMQETSVTQQQWQLRKKHKRRGF